MLQNKRLGKLCTSLGCFSSIDTLLAFDRKCQHKFATQFPLELGGYEAGKHLYETGKWDAGDREIEYRKYFFESLYIPTVLDPIPPAASSSYVVELEQEGGEWIVRVGHPSRYCWFRKKHLRLAIDLACEKARQINTADDPEQFLQDIITTI